VSSGFGFDRLIERFGIERRVHTAGESKAMLDPFRPEDPKDVERLKGLQERIHEMFISLVKSRRGQKLSQERLDLFSGAVWVGAEAVELGLVDGLGDLRATLRERYGDAVRLRPVPSSRPSFIARWLTPRAAGPELRLDPQELLGAIEARSAWSRLGL
jgi:ClpP class serine protease